MAEPEARAYTSKDFRKAVWLAAFLSWAAPTAFLVGATANPLVLYYGFLFGMPLSVLVCWSIGGPLLWRLMKSPIGWLKSAIWGGGIAVLMAALSIALGRYRGWRMSLDDSSFSRIGGGDYTRSIDGILTPYGWLILGQSTALFVLFGMGVALALRAIIGPGQQNR